MLVTRTLYQSPTDKALSWAFVAPVIIVLLVTAFIPLGWGLGLSVFRYKLNMPSATAFVGLQNYLDIFRDELVLRSLRNNVIFAVLSVSLELIVGVVVAMMLSDDSRFTRGMISILMVPMIVAPVAAGTLWRMMLDRTYGVVNYLLSFVGIRPISWIGTSPSRSQPTAWRRSAGTSSPCCAAGTPETATTSARSISGRPSPGSRQRKGARAGLSTGPAGHAMLPTRICTARRKPW